MRRFAKVDPAKLKEIQARELDQVALKMAWIEMADEAESALTRVADERPDLPIGCAFLDAEMNPRWIEEEDGLAKHFASVRGCWPTIREG